jgi:uncharacterized phiE125 gp8 family phage protein
MNSWRLRLVTAPTIEPVTLAEALMQCHADSSVEDPWFTGAIKSARIAVENFHGRANINRTYELILDKFPPMPFELPMPPLVSVTSIKYYDVANASTSLVLTDFLIDADSNPGFIAFNDSISWPSVTLRTSSAVKIEYVAGCGATASTVPEEVKSAIKLHVANAYENRTGEVRIPDAFYNILRPTRIAPSYGTPA